MPGNKGLNDNVSSEPAGLNLNSSGVTSSMFVADTVGENQGNNNMKDQSLIVTAKTPVHFDINLSQEVNGADNDLVGQDSMVLIERKRRSHIQEGKKVITNVHSMQYDIPN